MLEIGSLIVRIIEEGGYLGIMLLMAIESTFIPIPSELILPPAGYLVWKGKLNLIGVVIASNIGSLIGSFFTYYLGLLLGRPFVVRFGKYFLFTEEKLRKTEAFFKKYGHISIFIARLLPGIRHYISFPAGMAKMNAVTFSAFTLLGATIWSIILIFIGYHAGKNEELIKRYVHEITAIIVITAVILFLLFLVRTKKLRTHGF